MSAAPEELQLKSNSRRSVLRGEEAGRRAAIKRWHAGSAWERLRNRSRARREFELLAALLERGFPVPEPLALRERDGTQELVSGWIESALSLTELLRARRLGAREHARLAATLGSWLAKAHARGLRHRDLHGGNVLVDATGAVWLVDAGGARLGAALSAADRLESLVLVCADVREHSSAAWRARVWRAYCAELGELPLRERVREIEALAQERRRAVIERAQRRWLRDSSSCRRFELPGARGLCSSALAEAELESLAGAQPAEITGWKLLRASADSNVHARAQWLAAVRLCDHGLASARPLAWFQEPAHALWFALPEGSVPCELESALASLEPALADRGLALARTPGLAGWRAPDGRLSISGAERVLERPGRAPWPSR